VFGPGDLRGLPYVLDDEKRALVWALYEVFPPGHIQEGRRRFKRAGLSVSKGQAKTEFASILSCAELGDAPVRFDGWMPDGTPWGRPVKDPYIPLVAYTEEQSEELAYGTMMAIIQGGPLAQDFDVTLERITRRRGNGRAVPMAGAPNARDGARTTFQVFDETHHWTLPRLKKAHQTMLNNIPKLLAADPWTFEVTTAPEPGAGSVAEDLYEYAKAVDEGRVQDSRLFYFHRQAGDEHDLSTEEGFRAAVIEASGPTAGWRDVEAVVELWRDPTADRIYLERVWCNRLVQGSARAFDPLVWAEQADTAYTIPDGALVTLGFDGALFRDSSAIVVTEVATGFQALAGVWEQPYGPAGDDWKVPEPEVDETMQALFERFDVWRLYADPPFWQSWVATWSGRWGDRVVEWHTQRRQQMTVALEGFQTAMRAGDLTHDNDSTLARHVGNAHRHDLPQRDAEGKPYYLIRKEREDSPFKIDAAMAAVLSWEARTDAVASGAEDSGHGPSFYETHELRVLGG
jgi:phage terminase large subunit-like protein